MEKVYIDGELAYPIWYVSVKWIEDGEQDLEYSKWYEGLPEGRIYNSTGYYKMCKEDKTQSEIEQDAIEWFNKLKNNEEYCDKNVSDEQFTYEVWCLTRFCHHTFDTSQTDQEALDSFERFIRRMEDMNKRNGHYYNERNDFSLLPYYCLMGAEDRWRWYGGDYENRTDAMVVKNIG